MTLKQELPSGPLALLHPRKGDSMSVSDFPSILLFLEVAKETQHPDRSGHQPFFGMQCVVFKKNIFLKLFAHLWLQKLDSRLFLFVLSPVVFFFPFPSVVTRFLGNAYALCPCRHIQGRNQELIRQTPRPITTCSLKYRTDNPGCPVYNMVGELGSANRACLPFTQHSGKPYHAGLGVRVSVCLMFIIFFGGEKKITGVWMAHLFSNVAVWSPFLLGWMCVWVV